ncbi:hypothetical protein HUW51_01055 (plasmid) [Adhaeribacter swui]|uniref:Uncharacterized protein n=1 Tax=Adhaeribacter swui TaxID=2086471 RepID=A0A7G7G2J2_9BACT|nr:hypothetical protein HUW51_01055 [Adhaeribacter swui]
MVGLLDSIFAEKKIEGFSQNEVYEHLSFINEIILQERLTSRQAQYLKWKAKLNQRLLDLNRPL